MGPARPTLCDSRAWKTSCVSQVPHITDWMYPVPVPVLIMLYMCVEHLYLFLNSLSLYIYTGPGPKWAWARPEWARAQMGLGPNGPGPKWAWAQMGPGPHGDRINQKRTQGCDQSRPRPITSLGLDWIYLMTGASSDVARTFV